MPFPTVAAPFDIPTSRAGGFQVLRILANTCWFPLRLAFVCLFVVDNSHLVVVKGYLIVLIFCFNQMKDDSLP